MPSTDKVYPVDTEVLDVDAQSEVSEVVLRCLLRDDDVEVKALAVAALVRSKLKVFPPDARKHSSLKRRTVARDSCLRHDAVVTIWTQRRPEETNR